MLHRELAPVALVLVLSYLAACGSGDETAQTQPKHGDGGSAGSAVGGASGTGALAGVGGSAGDSLDASVDVDTSDDGGDATLDSAPDVADGDVEDAPVDVAIDAPVSVSCGDGIRDPVTEECDDGTASVPADSCNAECGVEDVLVHPLTPPDSGSPFLTRRLGFGRHTVAAGNGGFAVVSVKTQPAPTTISLRAFDTKGTPEGAIEISDNSVLMDSNPTVAAVPGGKYALVYTDNGADGGNRGVALRIIDPAAQSIGPLVRVNATTLGNQSDADVIWTGSELVVGWVDESKLTSAFLNTMLRRFSAAGVAVAGEVGLGTTATSEAEVALAEHNGTWAAAWRTYQGAGVPPIVTVRSGGTTWTTSLTTPGAADEKPALVSLDATRLLVLFVDGTGGPVTQRVRGAILDKAAPGDTVSFAIEPLVEPYKSDPSLWQMHVAAVRAGDRAFVAWRSEPVIGSPENDDVWLKEITWTPGTGTFTLDLSSEEVPLPRQTAHRLQGQQRPALAVMKLQFEELLATAWDDYGRVFGPIEGQPDTIAELIPLPIVRLPDADGGLGK